MTPREVMNRLRRENWIERTGKGAHVVFSKDGRTVVVSNHAGDIKHCVPFVRRELGVSSKTVKEMA